MEHTLKPQGQPGIKVGELVVKVGNLPTITIEQARASAFKKLKALIDETSIKAPEFVTSHGLTRTTALDTGKG